MWEGKVGDYQEPGNFSMYNNTFLSLRLKAAKATGNETTLHVELISDHVALA
jgi:hypothetical protein